jgi:site-specific recombinase XerD
MRPAKPWFWKERSVWCVIKDGHRIILAQGRKARAEAYAAFYALQAGLPDPKPVLGPQPVLSDPAQPPADLANGLTLAGLEAAYVNAIRFRVRAKTVVDRTNALRSLLSKHGTIPAQNVTVRLIEGWSADHRDWSKSTLATYFGYVGSLFRWAEREGLVRPNPIHGLSRPQTTSRGADCVISEEEHAIMLNAANPPLRQFLIALRETGARPGEIAGVTAQQFYPEQGVFILQEHKTEKSTGAVRVIYLTAKVVQMCQELSKVRPNGPLFLNTVGTPWNAQNVFAALKYLTQRCGLNHVIAYGLGRHSFATDALSNGVADAQVAALLGHQNTAMLHKHYSHLTARSQVLREALGRVR